MKALSLALFQNEELIGLLIAEIIAFSLITLIFAHFGTFKTRDKRLTIKPDQDYQRSRPKPVYNRRDAWIITIITVGYAIVSLWNLGSFKAPESYWQPTGELESVTLVFSEDTSFDAIYWISGEGDNNLNPTGYQIGSDFEIWGSDDQENWELLTTLKDASWMAWKINESEGWNYRFIKIQATNINSVLHEIGFRRSDHSGFLPVLFLSQSNPDNPYSGAAVIDEQDTLCLTFSYMNSSYFDEIYHGRNAYEIAAGQYMYASVHPLLGTSLIAAAIKIFGLNPFGWRIAGALFGIMMLPLFYWMIKRLFLRRRYAAAGTLLLAVDFMHYTTSRIGTLEPFSVFFILLMYAFMIDYCCMSFYDTPLIKTLKALALCGIAMGVAIAVKWTGAYGAVGLAVLFFASLTQRWKEYRKAKKKTALSLQEQFILTHFKKYTLITLLWCVFFFVIVPLIIYFAAYLPCMLVKNEPWSIQGVINQTIYMFNYHAHLEATHPFQSVWYQWILDIRPIWYYYGTFEDGISTISAFGNPFLWWGGLVSVILTMFHFIVKKDKMAALITISYLAQLVPWLFVSRCVFIYHYYPSVGFMIMAIVYVIAWLEKIKPESRRLIRFYILSCVFLFVLFLPVISGFKTTHAYIDHVLRWMLSWYFG